MNTVVEQRAQAYFERLMKEPGKWIRITVKKGDKKGRREIYQILKQMMDLSGLKYETPFNGNHYTIMFVPELRKPPTVTVFKFDKSVDASSITEIGLAIKRHEIEIIKQFHWVADSEQR